MSSLTATQRASAMYEKMKNISSGKIELEISWGTIIIVLLLALFYVAISAVGIDTFNKCPAMKGKKTQEDLNKYLAATMTIGLTIPFTLMLTKFAQNESALFMMIYGIMGIVGSAAALNWATKCEGARKEVKGYAGFSVASFSCTLIIAIFLLSRQVKAA